MKKLLLLIPIFGICFSCTEDDEIGIPPVVKGGEVVIPDNLKTIEADQVNADIYTVGTKAKIHGFAVEDRGRFYFKLKDGTMIQIFAYNTPDSVKNNLKNGKEVTVTGVFKDYTLKNGNIVKEIVYESEKDVVFGEGQQGGGETNVEVLDASKVGAEAYKDGKSVQLSGTVVVEGGKSYIKLKDDTKILIFTPKKEVHDVVRCSLVDGAKATIKGKFQDYKDKEGNMVKEIVYQVKEDVTVEGGAKPEPKNYKNIDASQVGAEVYAEGKAVNLKGVITVENTRPYITLKDGTKIQMYCSDFKNLPQDVKDKLVEGQEVTVKGVFKDFKPKTGEVVKEIIYNGKDDLVFGKSVTPQPKPEPQPQVVGNVFDFTGLEKNTSYTTVGNFKAEDGTTLEYSARTDVEGYEIDGGGLMLKAKDKNSDSFIKIVFENGVKSVKFSYRGAYTKKDARIISVYNGDKEIGKKEFGKNDKGEMEVQVNGTGKVEITIKARGPQVVIDNISWTK